MIAATTFKQDKGQDRKNEQDDIDVGSIEPLTSSYNLFLNMKMLTDPDEPDVNFYVYSMGLKRVALWGKYNKYDQKFKYDGSCRYRANILAEMNRRWLDNGYKSAGTAVKNRINEYADRYAEGLALKEGRVPEDKIKTHSEYLEYKFLLAYYNNKITQKELNKRYPNVLSNFENRMYLLCDSCDNLDYIFMEELGLINDKVIKYEQKLNLTDLSPTMRQLNMNVQQTVEKITERFYQEVKNGKFQKNQFYNNLVQCPEVDECHLLDPDNYQKCNVYDYGSGREYLT